MPDNNIYSHDSPVAHTNVTHAGHNVTSPLWNNCQDSPSAKQTHKQQIKTIWTVLVRGLQD